MSDEFVILPWTRQGDREDLRTATAKRALTQTGIRTRSTGAGRKACEVIVQVQSAGQWHDATAIDPGAQGGTGLEGLRVVVELDDGSQIRCETDFVLGPELEQINTIDDVEILWTGRSGPSRVTAIVAEMERTVFVIDAHPASAAGEAQLAHLRCCANEIATDAVVTDREERAELSKTVIERAVRERLAWLVPGGMNVTVHLGPGPDGPQRVSVRPEPERISS